MAGAELVRPGRPLLGEFDEGAAIPIVPTKREIKRLERTTAHHEAAHAVAHVRLGFRLFVVSIAADGRSFGRVSAFDDDDEAAVIAHYEDVMSRPRDALVQLYAGYWAERELGVDLRVAQSGAVVDFKRAAELVNRLGDYPTKEAFVREVQRHLRRSRAFVRRHWGDIRSVARELLRRKTLTGDELRSMLGVLPAWHPVPHPDRDPDRR